MAMYCGDEVRAVVADLGHSVCRFGQAGQDSPRHVFRSDVGRYTGEEGISSSDDENGSSCSSSYVAGDSALRVLRGGMDIVQPFASGDVHWDATEALLQHGLDSCLQHVDPGDYPLLLAENTFSSAEHKEKLFEMMFETFALPAAYVCHNATLSSFASGRPSSLVVDMGAAATRVTPVVDGYALPRSAVATHRGGFYWDQVFAEALHMDFKSASAKDMGGTKKRSRSDSSCSSTGLSATSRSLTPWYECAGTISTTSPADITTPLPLSTSFRRMHCEDTLRDVRHWMCFVPRSCQSDSSSGSGISKKNNSGSVGGCDDYNVAEIISSIPPYELPDGTLIDPSPTLSLLYDQHLFNPSFSSSSLRKTSRVVHEMLTNQSHYSVNSNGNGNSSERSRFLQHGDHQTHYDDSVDLAGLVMQTVLRTDVDARKELLGNILVVGGGALTDGVIARLQNDLSRLLPTHIKAKVVPSLLSLERQHAAWLGGSILGICGSFQQLWVSREEYQEHGAAILRQRCVH